MFQSFFSQTCPARATLLLVASLFLPVALGHPTLASSPAILKRDSSRILQDYSQKDDAYFNPSGVAFLTDQQSTLLGGGGCAVVAMYGDLAKREKHRKKDKTDYAQKMNGYGPWCISEEASWPAGVDGYIERKQGETVIYVILGSVLTYI